jgi:hypothetical protein
MGPSTSAGLYASTPVTTLETNSSSGWGGRGIDVLHVGGGGVFSLTKAVVFNVTNIVAQGKGEVLRISNGGRLVVPANFSIAGFTLDVMSGVLQGAGRNLTIRSGGVLSLRRGGRSSGTIDGPGGYVFGGVEVRGNGSVVLQEGGTSGQRGVMLRVQSLRVARGARVHADARGEGQGGFLE